MARPVGGWEVLEVAQGLLPKVKEADSLRILQAVMQLAALKALENKNLSRKEIFAVIGMNGDSRAFKRHLEPLLAEGFVEMTVPDKPNSRLQKYRLTAKNKAVNHA